MPLDIPLLYMLDRKHALDSKKMDALIKCKFPPPRDLFHPVLLYRHQKKLMFVLCRSCMEEERYGYCCHDDQNQRSFFGTWVLDELRIALEMQYEVLKCNEVWVYEVTQFDKTTGEGGIFHEYVNHFARIKEQASGLPSNLKSSQEIESYIKKFKIHEGIELNAHEIEKNSGLRWIAKLLLNSLWGKFGQETKNRTTIVKSPGEMHKIIDDPAKIVNFEGRFRQVLICFTSTRSIEMKLKSKIPTKIGHRSLHYNLGKNQIIQDFS
jgi:hypothetical protein